MPTKATFPASLLKRIQITQPLKEGLPAAASPIATSDLKAEGNLLTDSVSDFRVSHTVAVSLYPDGSAMRTVGNLLSDTLSSVDDNTAALLSPVVTDFAIQPTVFHDSYVSAVADQVLSSPASSVRAMQSGFNQALALLQARFPGELQTHSSMSEMLLRGYEALLPLLSKSAQTIASEIPLTWGSLASEFSRGGLSGPAEALSTAANQYFDTYAALTSQAISTHQHLRDINARRTAAMHKIADLTLWASVCDQAINSPHLTTSEAVKNVLATNSQVLAKAEAYLSSVEKSLLNSVEIALGIKKAPQPPGNLPAAYGGYPVDTLGF